MRSLLPLVASVLVVCGCGSDPPTEPLAGIWHAWLESPGGELPFGLEVARGDGQPEVVIVNGSERIPVPRVEMTEEGLLLGFDHYDSFVLASVSDGGRRLDGQWQKTAGEDELSRLPFHAVRRRRPRFEPMRPALGTVDGRWHVDFASSDVAAVGLFETLPGGVVQGTFLTATGDYRYLAGVHSDDRLRLSCFDGAHAFLFDARLLADGTLSGDFWSRDTWHETWTARRDEQAELPDGFEQASAIEGVELDGLVYPDLSGRMRSLDDQAFDGRARLLYVFGSWCPNCGDATRYMIELHRRYADRGLSIVGLAFELTGDTERDSQQVRRYVEHHGVTFPVLIAGPADKSRASDAFPLIDRIRAFPTTIFLDEAGTIRAIHSGFSGPVTAEAHAALKLRFESLIDQLLGEEAAYAD